MADSQYWVSLGQIIWIDILLSGDNAVLIALACRRLPEHQRRKAIMFGAGAAIVLRIIFAIFVVQLLEIPFLKLVGALLLFWIAVKLILPEESEAHEGSVQGSSSLAGAIKTIVIADAVMSLDNVIGIGAAAKGHVSLIVIGLAVSIPLIIWGSTLVLKLLDSHPWIMYVGGGLLGFIAGELIITDPGIAEHLVDVGAWLHWFAPAAGIVFVLATGWFLRRRMLSEMST
jgi:YjbE family integral membrane protein